MTVETYRPVSEARRPEPKTIDGLASVAQAMDVMRRHGISSLVIERRHEGDEYGLVVMHDIAEKVIAHNRSPQRVSVYEIMSKPVITVDTEMDIRYAIRLLTRFGVSRTLVMDKGELAGLVTLKDLVFAYIPPVAAPAEESQTAQA